VSSLSRTMAPLSIVDFERFLLIRSESSSFAVGIYFANGSPFSRLIFPVPGSSFLRHG